MGTREPGRALMANRYQELGEVFGIWAAGITFVGSYLYCIVAYGFLLGLGLGWLPSAIVAGIAYVVMRWGWPLIGFLLGMVLLLVLTHL